MDLRDSHLHCPRDGKRLVVDRAEEEGQRIVTHMCISCTYAERAPAQPQPQPRPGAPWLAELRAKVWSEVIP